MNHPQYECEHPIWRFPKSHFVVPPNHPKKNRGCSMKFGIGNTLSPFFPKKKIFHQKWIIPNHIAGGFHEIGPIGHPAIEVSPWKPPVSRCLPLRPQAVHCQSPSAAGVAGSRPGARPAIPGIPQMDGLHGDSPHGKMEEKMGYPRDFGTSKTSQKWG